MRVKRGCDEKCEMYLLAWPWCSSSISALSSLHSTRKGSQLLRAQLLAHSGQPAWEATTEAAGLFQRAMLQV